MICASLFWAHMRRNRAFRFAGVCCTPATPTRASNFARAKLDAHAQIAHCAIRRYVRAFVPARESDEPRVIVATCVRTRKHARSNESRKARNARSMLRACVRSVRESVEHARSMLRACVHTRARKGWSAPRFARVARGIAPARLHCARMRNSRAWNRARRAILPRADPTRRAQLH